VHIGPALVIFAFIEIQYCPVVVSVHIARTQLYRFSKFRYGLIGLPLKQIGITLGKNRQVRRMTAKVAFPTLRLLRSRIESLTIQDMMPGDVSEIPFSIIDQSVLKKERNQEKKPKKFLMRKR